MRVCRDKGGFLFLARSHAEGDGEWRRRQGTRRMREHAFGATAGTAAEISASLTAVISSAKMRVLRYLVITSSLRVPASKAILDPSRATFELHSRAECDINAQSRRKKKRVRGNPEMLEYVRSRSIKTFYLIYKKMFNSLFNFLKFKNLQFEISS